MWRSKKDDIDEWTENIEGDLKETKTFKIEVQTGITQKRFII